MHNYSIPITCEGCRKNSILQPDYKKYLATFRNKEKTFENHYLGQICGMIIRAKSMDHAGKIAEKIKRFFDYDRFITIEPFPGAISFTGR